MPDTPATTPVHERALVTGVAGFLGSHLAKRLVREGLQVLGLARPASSLWRVAEAGQGLDVVRADLRSLDPSELAEKLGDVDVVYHMAAAGVSKPGGDAEEVLEANILGTSKMLQLARTLSAKRFIYCGSCFEYGSGAHLTETTPPAPVSEYGASKVCGSVLVDTSSRSYGLPVVTLRPFTAYGPYEAHYRLVPHVINLALDGKDIELTPGDQERDFVYIDDIIEAFLTASTAPDAVGRTLNVCTGVGTSVRNIVETILDLLGSSSKALFGHLPYRGDELMVVTGDPALARQVLGWTAGTPVREGLEETIRWFVANRTAYSAAYGAADQKP